MVTTNDDALAERLRLLRNHGQSQRYRHDVLGYHFRTTDIQAAIGLAQIGKLPGWNEQRIANARYLSERLKGVQVPVERPNRRHVFHQYTIRASGNREALQNHLKEQGIGTAVHYPYPIHQQPLYQSLGYHDVLPQAEAASREVLSLPIHQALSQSDLERIVAAVNGFQVSGFRDQG
jgi:dTDP-4-amino-4,6-dideoxygalactose transaminase